MRYIKYFMLATWPILIIFNFIAYTLGQSSIKRTTVVQSGESYYDGVFYGECAWNEEPWRSRQFCATNGTRDKNGNPKVLK